MLKFYLKKRNRFRKLMNHLNNLKIYSINIIIHFLDNIFIMISITF
jgi:hypothetical protein